MNSHSFFNSAAGAIVLLMLWSAAPVNAQGLLYTVDSTGDGGNVGTSFLCDDGTGHCTLRAALEAANAHPGTDGIRFSIPVSDPGYNGVFWTINLTRVLPDVSDSVGIIAPGANLLTVRRGAGGEYRIFKVTTTGTVTFSGLTINNGLSGNGTFGGGIQNLLGGTVNVTNCTLSANRAPGGGGIHNNSTGSVNVTNSTLSGNFATGSGGKGGGIFNGGSGPVEVLNSTLSGNAATGNGGGISTVSSGGVNVRNCTLFSNIAALDGGGLDNSSPAIVNVTNSTLYGNSAGASGVGHGGGGIVTAGNGPLNIEHCTLSANSTNGSGGGILNNGSTVEVKNTIIALNTASSSIPDVSGAFASEGFNLIGWRDGSAGFDNPSDQTGTVASPLDPKLDPNGLQNSGGPTRTVALQTGSPAIDKGTNISRGGILTTDQRGTGFPRTADYSNVANVAGGVGTDIGAFEGTVLKITSISRLTNGHILLQGLGVPNLSHTVEASSELSPNSLDPSPFTINADGTGALQYDDAAAVGLEKRFYRLAFP